ncbi:MAG TPA: hypothetical protein VGO63_03740 [Candidatus Paceibacterota bacterium]|jgi:hypothetical protein|nr:hypothetical protein [Candidatus Paceibacterota bacterium]
MKKYLSLVIVFVLIFVVGAKMTRAENGPSANAGARTDVKAQLHLGDTEKIKEFRKEQEGKRMELKAEMETNRAEWKAKIEAMRSDAKGKFEALRTGIMAEKDAAKAKIKEARLSIREKALERFGGAITRITGLKDRINTRISELEVKGVNVADAKAFMATAQAKLDAADEKTAEINAFLAVSIDQLSAENKAKLKTLAADTQTLLKEAHAALKDAIKSLKENVKIKLDAEAGAKAEAGN